MIAQVISDTVDVSLEDFRVPSILQRSDYMDFLLRMKFGRELNLQACLDQAYQDFKRTLRGVAELTRGGEARRTADKALNDMISSIQGVNATQNDFDAWHRQACERLAAIYREHGYKSFCVGQAQKWINMSLKYIYLIGESHLPNFDHLYDLCHVPLDKVLIRALLQYQFEPLPCAWSKLDDYEIYLDRQRWVRETFSPSAPLDVEFSLWMGRALPSNAIKKNGPAT